MVDAHEIHILFGQDTPQLDSQALLYEVTWIATWEGSQHSDNDGSNYNTTFTIGLPSVPGETPQMRCAHTCLLQMS